MSAPQSDNHWMDKALRLARRARGAAHPNPRVGCVLVDDANKMLAMGWHKQDGLAHAETMALDYAGENAKGSTCYVTLEPCAHHGRTPPCAMALLESGVKRVVVAMQDPDPRVSGKGIQLLREGGVEVSVGLMQQQAEQLNPGYIRRNQGGRPWLRCKLAVSVDGRTALADGQSRWITSSSARKDGHRLRAESAAIMTGIGTVLADNPRFDIRHVAPLPNPPLRVVLDSTLRIADNIANLALLQCPGKILVFCCGDGPPPIASKLPGQIEVVPLPVEMAGLPKASLDYLAATMRINEVLLESGSTLSGACLNADLLDELVIYMSGSILGDSARGMFTLPPVENIEKARNMRLVDCSMLADNSGARILLRRE